MNIAVIWMGERVAEIDVHEGSDPREWGLQVSTPAYLREWSEPEYEAAGLGPTAAVRRELTCKCTQAVVSLPDGGILSALHSDARWEGSPESGYTFTVSRISDTPFMEVAA